METNYIQVDLLDLLIDGNGLLSFTSSLGVMCRARNNEGEVIHVEITKQQCIDSHLITKEAFEAALQKFSSVFSAKGGAQNTTPLVEAVPIASTSKSNTSQGAPTALNQPANNGAQVIGIPEILRDPNTKKVYQRGKFLGKGNGTSFYELTEMKMDKKGNLKTTENTLAGKIVSKQFLVEPYQRDQIAEEITIHRTLNNKHVVKFHSFFEDKDFVYIVLELCKKGSLMELLKRRKTITEPEARYFMFQLVSGVKHLYQKHKIIHRNLKPDHLFLNDNMEVKIGGFSLVTKLDYDGERKKILCGTPIYMAPEVLSKKGYSYEVDIWSMGCILYILLVGYHPFESQTSEQINTKIKKNEYSIPSHIGPSARSLITRMLQAEPSLRPKVDHILSDDFITQGYLPSRLPLSCLTTAPRFDRLDSSIIAVRRPLGELNRYPPTTGGGVKSSQVTSPPDADSPYADGVPDGSSPKHLLRDLQVQLKKMFAAKPTEKVQINMEESEDPAAIPMVWVAKWVDYSDKYGFGYLFNDDTIGVNFNDSTKSLLFVDRKNIQYVERDGTERYYTMENYPSTMDKKIELLKYFLSYMSKYLSNPGGAIPIRGGSDAMTRLPVLHQWFRFRRAVVMHLTNGTLQVNYFKEHIKLILCPVMGAVTVINARNQFRTFSIASLAQFGCSVDLLQRLEYVSDKIHFLLQSNAP